MDAFEDIHELTVVHRTFRKAFNDEQSAGFLGGASRVWCVSVVDAI